MKLRTFIDTLPMTSTSCLDYEHSSTHSVAHSVTNKTPSEVVEFLSLCSALIGIAPHQLLDLEIADFINKIHDLEDDLINYQYLSDMEALLMEGARIHASTLKSPLPDGQRQKLLF